jgi:hypothetical protein
MGGVCNMHGRDKKCTKIFIGRHEEKRPLERPRRRWEDNIKMDIKEIGWEGVNWIHLAR